MDGPDRACPLAPAGRGPRCAAVLAWAACAFVVWNVVFDAIVIQSGREYLTRQALHRQGQAPAVTIRAVMDAGVGRAARTATLSGGAVAAAGLLATWLATWRRPRVSGTD